MIKKQFWQCFYLKETNNQFCKFYKTDYLLKILRLPEKLFKKILYHKYVSYQHNKANYQYGQIYMFP